MNHIVFTKKCLFPVVWGWWKVYSWRKKHRFRWFLFYPQPTFAPTSSQVFMVNIYLKFFKLCQICYSNKFLKEKKWSIIIIHYILDFNEPSSKKIQCYESIRHEPLGLSRGKRFFHRDCNQETCSWYHLIEAMPGAVGNSSGKIKPTQAHKLLNL